jgi:SWI/SNF-related matrix-associated actin-dependent regulator 1 of chromatin subfamily A
MLLDYNPKKHLFFVKVARNDPQVSVLMKSHGLDMSLPDTTPMEAVLMTSEPYAAASFAAHATERARAQLAPILSQVELSRAENSDVSIRIPMDKELWPFQRASVAYALSRRHCLIGDQPGLGKTPIAIAFANEVRAKRVLVICPASIRLQWVARIREWTTMPWPYHIYPILSGNRGVHPTAEWTVVSYDLARTEAIGRALAQGRYDVLILDEAHYLKTIDAERTQSIFGDHTGVFRKAIKEDKKIVGWKELFPALASRCERVLCLTGTPLPNRPREAYTIARSLCFDSIDWMSEERFKERFNPSARLEGVRKDGSTYMYTREEVGRAGELQNRMRANFMARHLKRDVMPQLKLPVYDLIQAEETGPVKQALKAESLLQIDPEQLAGANAEVLGNWAEVRHMMGRAIAPQVCSYVGTCLDGGDEKILLGGWHKDVLDIYCSKLAAYGVLRIDGSTSSNGKTDRVNQFRTDPTKRVMVGNVISLGTGTDGLQDVCDHIVIGEPDPVPGNNEQFVDRLDRGGQTRTVLADLFVAPNSLLERILARALHKRQNTHQALDEVF